MFVCGCAWYLVGKEKKVCGGERERSVKNKKNEERKGGKEREQMN